MNEFDEIRPYEAGEMRQAFEELLADRQFNLVLKGFAPWLPKAVRNGVLRLAFTGVKTPLQFQMRFMKPVVKYIIRRHTDGCTFDDAALRRQGDKETRSQDDGSAYENQSLQQDKRPDSLTPRLLDSSTSRYTFISNHRDIVLDSALLDVMLVEHDYPTTVEIGIGDNLLIYPWIKRLVRMNKAFIVRRGLTARAMLESSLLMSRYIHHAVNEKRENIWIAQREGRAKDSGDRTQDAVLKMLAMGGKGTPAEKLADLNIVPLTISYEFDPCDYLKAQEFQQKRDNPAFKKSRQDDLDNMRVGIFGYKGRVHYCCGAPVNEFIGSQGVEESRSQDVTQSSASAAQGTTSHDFYRLLAEHIDREIHAGYCLYPNNYIALDQLNGDSAYASHYTEKDVARFNQYIDGQLAKITLPNKDEAFLRERMLTMYANPLRNQLAATT